MKTVTGDLWAYAGPLTFVVVPTNLQGVMGRGVAAQAKDRYQGLEVVYKNTLGHWRRDGLSRTVYYPPTDYTGGDYLCLLPVKYRFDQPADEGLIAFGLGQLVCFIESAAKALMVPDTVALPMLGAGFGGLVSDVSLGLMTTFLRGDRYTLVEPDADALTRHAHTMQPGAGGRVDPRATATGATEGWRTRTET